MQYSILIYGAEGVFDRLPQEEQDAMMQSHRDLQNKLDAKGSFATAKLMPTQNAITLKPTTDRSAKPVVVDGPFAETKEQFLGFYIVECDTLDEVIDLAAGLSSSMTTLEIRPVAWAGGILGDSE